MTSSLKKLIIYSIFLIGFLTQGHYGLELDVFVDEDDISGPTNNNVFDLMKIYEQGPKNAFDHVILKAIPGTNLLKTALHFEEGFKMIIEGDEFPEGLPKEFTFECIFRTEHQPTEPWYLFYLASNESKSLLQLSIDPNSKTIDFVLPKSDADDIEMVSFEQPKIFDGSWHKVMLRLTNDSVGMWVDCERVLDLEGREEVQFERGPIEDSDGFLTLAVGVSSGNSISIDIQQMIVSGDLDKLNETSCEKLPKLISKLTEENKSANESIPLKTCPKQCPAGPVGPPGQDGLPGPIGLTGLRGPEGEMGREGPRGSKGYGFRGDKGDKGEPGVQGPRGSIGHPGEKGDMGYYGQKGETGPKGLPGINGIPGRPGPRGLPAVDQSKIQDLCIGYVRDYIKEHKSKLIGRPGRDGLIGLPGQKGEIGYLGMPGLDGFPGMKGDGGRPGPPGEPGVCLECHL